MEVQAAVMEVPPAVLAVKSFYRQKFEAKVVAQLIQLYLPIIAFVVMDAAVLVIMALFIP
jgi:hypothetical protein